MYNFLSFTAWSETYYTTQYSCMHACTGLLELARMHVPVSRSMPVSIGLYLFACVATDNG
jgi:hypothetical protein